MKITHYINKTTTESSQDLLTWLDMAGYMTPPMYFDSSIPTLLLLESKNKDAWAFYHPPIGNLVTEYTFIGIPTEVEASGLLNIVVEIIQSSPSLLSAAGNALAIEKYFA